MKLVADALRQGEAPLEAAFVQIIVKDATDAARLVAMLEKEIFVAPFLVARMQVSAEGRERFLAGLMKMHGVFRKAVIGREIHAAAEPPDGITAFFRGDKTAHVHVRGGAVGIARMQHQRNTHGFPFASRQLGAVRGGRGGQLVAGDVGEIDAAALEEGAFFDQPRNATTTLRTCPRVAPERLAVEGFQRCDNAFLQPRKVGFDSGAIHWSMARWPLSAEWRDIQYRGGIACRRNGCRRRSRRRSSGRPGRCRRAR